MSNDKDPIPNELLCLICKEMLTDAVVIPCCGNSFCDDCESHLHTRTHTYTHSFSDQLNISVPQVFALPFWIQINTPAQPVNSQRSPPTL